MSGGELVPDAYSTLVAALKDDVRSAQLRARRVVNTELVTLYWSIGDRILRQQQAEGWGTGVLRRLSDDLRTAFPDMQGFSRRNLFYMRSMAEAWPDGEVVQQAVAQMPWGHITVLLGQLEEQADRDWYAAATVEHGWSRKVLLNQIKNRLHERLAAAPSNFPARLADGDSELAQQLTKDPYVFDFLTITGSVAESELITALLNRLQETLLELGRGFALVGRQAHFEVGGDDFYIDLLLFHVQQLRYVVIELKIGRFRPEYTGQLGFYVSVVDDQLRDPDLHSPTVGILLCAGRNDSVVRYALRGAAAPMAVADYTYESLPDHERSTLPTAADLAALLDAPIGADPFQSVDQGLGDVADGPAPGTG
ncbi:MAG: PDDEXK nuclease domain-containing protein [Jatrophihabitantaceae bacterium]